jgi:molybdopterin synthase sulfur carrier subunit
VSGIKLLYFARVREAIGCDSEHLNLPDSVTTINHCIDWLESLDTKYAAAFSDRTKLRFALDQQMVWEETLLEGAAELAIFPPVTGG